jgi:hypothetical protein
MLTAVRYLVRVEIQANKTEDEAVADKPPCEIYGVCSPNKPN